MYTIIHVYVTLQYETANTVQIIKGSVHVHVYIGMHLDHLEN